MNLQASPKIGTSAAAGAAEKAWGRDTDKIKLLLPSFTAVGVYKHFDKSPNKKRRIFVLNFIVFYYTA